MNLKEFLEKIGGKESDIINYSGVKALEAVKQDWYTLNFAIEQTPEICLEAVKQDWYALQYVREQTPEICLEAVKQDWYALQFVNKNIFTQEIKEYTMKELKEKLWEEFKIVN